jgi:hypothetical protein
MTKIVTVMTTIYDTKTKKIEKYQEIYERIDEPEQDLNGVAPSLLKLTAGQTYTDTVCAKCDCKIAVRIGDYQAGSNYCQACAMAKIGG